MRVLSVVTLLLASVASGSSTESITVEKSVETCEYYSRLLSADFWRIESRKRAKAVFESHVDPVISNIRLQLNLVATRNVTAGLLDGTIGLLELARAYDTVGCATASMILARLETRSRKQMATQMLQDFAKRIKEEKDLDKYAPKLITALSSLCRDIDKFEFQKDMPDFPTKKAGERMMQAATATHKARGTLKHIALSARQYVVALHTDYLVRKGLVEPVLVKSSRLRNAPATVNTEIGSDYLTYVVVNLKAAQQWNTISFIVRAKGQSIPVANPNIKGGEQTFIAFPVTGKTSIDLAVFNGLNCKNTNWLPSRFSATISFLRRTKKVAEEWK